MNFPVLILTAFLAAPALYGQSAKGPARDTALEELEARLQKQRAAALRTRLVISTDELARLQAHYTAAGNSGAAAQVQADLDAVRAAIQQLGNIARGQSDPPAPGELAEGEKLSATALAARRIDRVLAKFSVKSPSRPEPGAAAPAARPHILKMDKARLRSGADASGGEGSYWTVPGHYALWSIPDLAPGRYDVIVRYTAGQDAGGKATIRIAGETLEVSVPAGEKNDREQRLPAGAVTIKEPGADVRLEMTGLAGDAKYLWKVDSVLLQPSAKRP